MNLPLPGQFVQPDIVASHFHLKEGDVVADFGAGSGFFLKSLSEGVGSSGRVFACEIQKNLVDKIGDFIRLSHLQNVHPLWCDLEEIGGIKISDRALDAAILVNTLFMLEDKSSAISEMRRTLRPGANFFVIDWSESFGGLGPQPAQVVEKDAAVALLESHRFHFEREYPAGDHHYGLAFKAV